VIPNPCLLQKGCPSSLNDLVTVRSDPHTKCSATTPVVDHAYTNPKKEGIL
jgi:hypothetical protein